MNTQLFKIKFQKKNVFRQPEEGAAQVQSKRPAGLFGPAAAALGLTETLNLHIWANNLPQVIYLNGMILVIAGLAILRIHKEGMNARNAMHCYRQSRMFIAIVRQPC